MALSTDPAGFAPASRPLLAAGYAVSGMGLIGVIDNAMPEISAHMGLWQFHYARSLMALVLLGGVAFATGYSLRPNRPWGVLGRGILIGISMVIYFACVGYLPVAQVLAALFTAPLILLVVGLFEGARPRRAQVVWTVAGFLGCLAVVQPDPGNLGWLSVAPMAAALFYAFGNKVTRTWGRDDNPWVLVGGYLAVMGVIGGAGVLLAPGGDTYLTRGWIWVPAHVWGLVAMQAVGSLVAIAALAQAYKIAAPAYVGAFEYTVLVVAAGIGYLLWGHSVNALGVVGIGVILVSGAALARIGDRP